jgi:hypothetical protein
MTTTYFYIYYILIIIIIVISGDACEVLFTNTSQVIKYHNYPDILKLSSDNYEEHNIIRKCVYASYSGLLCLKPFIIPIIIILIYKILNNKLTNNNSLLVIILFWILYLIFILLNGLNILSFYNKDYFIGHKLLYLFIILISLYTIINI